MFSGIVKGVGRIVEQADAGGDRRIVIDTAGVVGRALEPGASIAVNGCCLTVTSSDGDRFSADVSGETLAVTTFAALAAGAPVNLEPSLRVGDALDGHWVTGHVDGFGRVARLEAAARSVTLAVELPAGLARYVAHKGSVTVDGVSLTVNTVDAHGFEVNVIPATLERTIIAGYRPGTAVNIEVDIIARYLERLSVRFNALDGSGTTP